MVLPSPTLRCGTPPFAQLRIIAHASTLNSKTVQRVTNLCSAAYVAHRGSPWHNLNKPISTNNQSMQCHRQWTLRQGPAVRCRPALHIPVSIDIGKRCIHRDLNKHEQILEVGGGRPCVRVCVFCVCVTRTYSGVDIHPSIRTYMYSCKMIMYVEVWSIMVCNLDVLDQTSMSKPPTL